MSRVRPPTLAAAPCSTVAHVGGASGPRSALTAVTVRRMRRRDVEAVAAMEALTSPRPWSATLFASELGRRDRSYLVATAPPAAPHASRELVGYAGVLLQAADAHVTTVTTAPAHHRRKIATRLLVALLRAARDMGGAAATLEVRAGNHGAQRLYSGFGFVPVGVRPRYYAETGEDAIIMWAYDVRSEAYEALLDEQQARAALPGGASGAADLAVPWVQGRIGLEASAHAGRAEATSC